LVGKGTTVDTLIGQVIHSRRQPRMTHLAEKFAFVLRETHHQTRVFGRAAAVVRQASADKDFPLVHQRRAVTASTCRLPYYPKPQLLLLRWRRVVGTRRERRQM